MTKGKKITLIAVAAAIILLAVIYEAFLKNKFTLSKSSVSLNYTAGSRAEVYSHNKNLFYLTKDALQLISSTGDVIWSDTFNMSSPAMINDEGIAAVMEKDGRLLKVYGESGPVSSITTDNPIVSASINNSGAACIISKGESRNLEVFNSNGKEIFNGSFASDDGLPVCSDISDDGKILAVSFLDTSDINLKSKVCFYYIGENSGDISQNSDSDDMFASYIEDGAVVFKLSFMQGNTLAALSDKSLKFINLNPTGNEKFSEAFNYEIKNKIRTADFSDKKSICIAFGEALLNSHDALKPNTVKWFGCKGGETGAYEAPKDIEAVSSGYDATIVSMGRQFAAIDYRGDVLWEYTATQDVKKMIFAASREDVIIVGTEEAYSVNVNDTERQKNKTGADGDSDGGDNKTDSEEEKNPSENDEKETDNSKAAQENTENVQNESGGNAGNGNNNGGNENNNTANNNTVKTKEKSTEKTVTKITQGTEENTSEKKTETTTAPKSADTGSEGAKGSSQAQSSQEGSEEEPEENENTEQNNNAPVMPE